MVVMLRWSGVEVDDGFLRHAGGNLEKISKFIVRIYVKTESRFCMIKTLISLSSSGIVCVLLKHEKSTMVFFA